MTNKKYSPRSMPLVTRQSYDVERSPVMPSWMKEFANSLEKEAVEPMRNEPTLYDQITSIMGGTIKSKYPTVEAAVEDMKKRTGLAKFLGTTVSEGSKKKLAQADIDKAKDFCEGCKTNDANCKCEPGCTCCMHCLLKKKTSSPNIIKLFKENPDIKRTVDNYIDDTHGNLSIPAILQQMKSIHSGDVLDDSLWKDETFLNYLKTKIDEVRAQYPNDSLNYQNLGKVPQFSDAEIDPSNTDALHSLMPSTGK